MERATLEDVGCGLLLLLGVIGCVPVTSTVVNAYGAPFDIAQIEQLRHDAAHVDPAQAEDVIGQVTQWNQTIASNKTRNAFWATGWATADIWDTVEPIKVPSR